MPFMALFSAPRHTPFQSTPTITGGRCIAPCSDGGGTVSFNPRPPLLAGDASSRAAPLLPATCFNPRPPLLAGDATATVTVRTGLGVFQSTPTITGGRCRSPTRTPTRPRQFQSTPTITGGRCLERGSWTWGFTVVSIHAHHYWRAMLWRCAPGPPCPCFNPRPPLLAGDARRALYLQRSMGSFNPRPPLLAGDARPRC